MKQLLVIFATAASMFGTSCTNTGGASTSSNIDSTAIAKAAIDSVEDRNKATALASLQAFNSGNLDGVLKDASPDAVEYGDGSYPPVKGLDSIKPGLKAFLTAFPDYKGENLLALADGNHVAVFADWSGTFKNPFMGIKPTGKSFKIKDVDLYTFNDAGKVTEHHSVQLNKTIFDMVGAKMSK